MATKFNRLGLVWLFIGVLCTGSRGQTGLVATDSLREKIWHTALGEVGLREPRGRNDHPRILDYHRAVSTWLYKHRPVAPYCASFVWYCYTKAGVKPKIANPARAREWFLVSKQTVLTQQSLRGNRRMLKLPKKGDVIGYIFYGGAISHVEILERIDLEEGYVYAIGANTSGAQAYNTVNREGDGVYYVRRSVKSFYKISDVLTP